MPRQTDQKQIKFPDGFKFGISTGKGYSDVGVLAGGATATFNWDEFYMDGGNYEGLVDRAVNPTVALAPSAILNWDPEVIAQVFPGFMKSSTASSPTDGVDVEYNGTERHVSLSRVALRLIHFPDYDEHTLIEDNITLDETGTNNDLAVIPKTAFTGALTWTNPIEGYVEVDGRREVHYDDRDAVASRGAFCTDDTNLYLIEDSATYDDEAAMKTGLAGKVVKFYKEIDWLFLLYNAKVDAGGQFNFKGAGEDGLDEITVSFTGKPDPADSYKLFKFFVAN